MHIITYKLSSPPSVDTFYKRSLLLSRAEIVPRLSSVSISRVPYLIIHTKITMECRSKLQNTGNPQKHTSHVHIVLQCCAVKNRPGKKADYKKESIISQSYSFVSHLISHLHKLCHQGNKQEWIPCPVLHEYDYTPADNSSHVFLVHSMPKLGYNLNNLYNHYICFQLKI